MEEVAFLGKYQVSKTYRTSNIIMRVVKCLALIGDLVMLLGFFALNKLAHNDDFLKELPKDQAEIVRSAGEQSFWWIPIFITLVGPILSAVMVYNLFTVKGEHFNLIAQTILTLLPLLNVLVEPQSFNPVKLAVPLVWVALTYLMYRDREQKVDRSHLLNKKAN
ncbi:hypothetical protein D3H64_09775 [Atopobacter sp. AH10]|uniref:hypothetical protein n=1 Tax=Atopobacter sp. AH10 TaxID=2315861 RepID=UPI000EF27BD7|nr:hypothetical protein [Atopobacter sp. AH10]RLK62456.1 hypothetical protein D3H64_09775 [Atopobacter sp. AH10]